MPDAAANHDPILREHGYHHLRIKRVDQETHDAASFVLDVADGLRETFQYRPGQFCTFRVHIDGEEHLRSYSMSSAPAIDPDLTVTVKRVAGGLVSNWFLDHLHEDDEIEVTKPAGVFCPHDTDQSVLAFCGGSGITPVMSIAKSVLATTERTVRLLYANRDADSVIFQSVLDELSAKYPGRLEVRHHFDSDAGFLSTEDVSSFAATALDAHCYVCGPGPFMDLVESTLSGLGVTQERIFIERFLVEQQEKEEAATGGTSDPAAEMPTEVTVILSGKKTVIPYQPGDTLLETARRGGLRPPFSCEAGNCATCMAFLKAGAVRMRANNALTPEEVEEGWVLTCQSLPFGPSITVEYEAM